MSGSKRTNVPPKEWAKHLRPFGKKEFWSSVRNLFRSEEKELLLKNDNPNDWGVGADIKWPRTTEEELAILDAMNSGEPGFIFAPEFESDEKTFNEVPLPYIVAKRIDNGINEKLENVVYEDDKNVVTKTSFGHVATDEEKQQRLKNSLEQCKNGVQPLTNFESNYSPAFKPINLIPPNIDLSKLPPEAWLVPAPSGFKIKPADENTNTLVKLLIDRYGKTVEELEKNTQETFRSIRESMGEPGPQSTDDLLLDDKPLPKVVTIEVKGLPNTGKIMILQMIDKALHEKFGITVLCAELEDKENLCDLDNIPQHHIDAMKSGKILIEMNIKEIKEKIPFPSSLQCPCCD